jgi:hypothetical protein
MTWEEENRTPENPYPFERIAGGQFDYKTDLAWAIQHWQDRYKGQRCFVIGNGSSLSETPLDSMIGEHCFATNKIADIYERTMWRPTLYQCMTTWTGHWIDHIMPTIDLGIPSFIWWRRAEFTGYRPNIIWTDFHDDEIWRDDVSEGIMRRGSSGLATLQIAMYLGFNPIILVGFDGKFRAFDEQNEADPNHFNDDYLSFVTDEQAERWNREWPKYHAMAKEAADRRGIEIIDATIDGSLTMYPKGDIHDICR